MADPVTGIVLAQYDLDIHGMKVGIEIRQTMDFVPLYSATYQGIGVATRLLITSLRSEIIAMVPIEPSRVGDKAYMEEINVKYLEASNMLLDKYLPGTDVKTKQLLIAYIINILFGLGDLEVLLADENLEEIAVNGAASPVWVFHKEYGWCKSTIKPGSDQEIYEQASGIGRRVGRQITNLAPLMDAELSDGSRINATLAPISQMGNTITIRKFVKNPWTMPMMIANHTVSPDLAALVWLSIQYEISLLISGGTASGKTSILNASSIFFPVNRRIVSVEETRELELPKYLHWVPMVTRQPNPEGKGAVSLYELMINALRQRPDIMLVGEVRVETDAQTLFEAVHTGHAVYGTVHADNAQDTVVRMTNPPINIPKIMLNSLGGIVVAFRHRMRNIRRILEIAEMMSSGDANVLYRWSMRDDTFTRVSDMTNLADTLMLYTGLTRRDIIDDLAEKSRILQWMANNKVFAVNDAGLVIAHYYKDRGKVTGLINDGVAYSRDLFE